MRKPLSLLLAMSLISATAFGQSIIGTIQGAEYNHPQDEILTQVKNYVEKMHVSPNVKDSYGNGPLAWAVYYNLDETCSYLIKNGAKIDAVNNLGRTPLALAIERGFPSTVKLLLENGAPYSEKLKINGDQMTYITYGLAATYDYRDRYTPKVGVLNAVAALYEYDQKHGKKKINARDYRDSYEFAIASDDLSNFKAIVAQGKAVGGAVDIAFGLGRTDFLDWLYSVGLFNPKQAIDPIRGDYFARAQKDQNQTMINYLRKYQGDQQKQ